MYKKLIYKLFKYKLYVNIMINEYELLILENNELKQKITLLENNNIINENIKIKEQLQFNENTILYLHTNMINKNIEINNLKLENKELKQKISILENRIIILETENKIIKEENKLLKIDNIKINKRIDFIENNIKISKIELALENINNFEKLETKLFKIQKYLKALRYNRNSICQFLYDNDSSEIIMMKKIYLLEKLSNFEHKDIFDSEYTNGFIDEIINYLQNNIIEPTNISEDDLYIFEKFKNKWNDVFIFE